MIPTRLHGWWRWARPQTLRGRLTWWYATLLVPLMLGFGLVLYVSLAHSLSREIDRSLVEKANRIVAAIDRHTGLPEPPDPFSLPGAEAEDALYDLAGHRIVGTDDFGVLPLASTLRGSGSGEWAFHTLRATDGSTWRVLVIPVALPNGSPGALVVGRSDRYLRPVLGRLELFMALGVPITLALAVAGGLFLAGRALEPIEHIATAAERISAENLSRRLNLPKTTEEVGRLARTFNGMLDRLDRAFQRQRQFTADASHELRTPLAALINQAEVTLERGRTPGEYQGALVSIKDEAERMAQLINALLDLARAEAGQVSLARDRLDLRDLAGEVVATMAPLARERDVRLELGHAESVVVEGDQTRLTQLLVNLLDNGIKYTPAGGTVVLSVRPADGDAVLEVSDTGIGIAPEHLPHVFERFYRADAARARPEGGAGLGLALARWVAQSHDGNIQVRSTPGRGTTFTVRLPRPTDRIAGR